MTSQNRTTAAIQARRRSTETKLEQVKEAITLLRRQKAPITFPAVARRADVSRTFLYENSHARTMVSDAIADAAGQRRQAQNDNDTERETAWKERALNAEDELKAAHAEIRTQRSRIAQLLGQIRDLEEDTLQDAAQRLTSENTTLKQRVRQLTEENRTLTERLQAARSNTRFQDRKIAQLEAQLLDQPPNQH